MAVAGSLIYDANINKKGFDEGIDDINKKASKLDNTMSGAGNIMKTAFEFGAKAVRCNSNSCWSFRNSKYKIIR